ncbi:MAG: DISARM system phospholipase D-like protein DrmC [Elainellaceae cyanobacterium]
MTPLSPKLLAQIRNVAQTLPPAMLVTVIENLTSIDMRDMGIQGYGVSQQLCQALPKTQWRQDVLDLLSLWQADYPASDMFALTAALAVAAHCEAESRRELSMELVWTGPNPQSTPLRRTDQALLQLIRSAKEKLLIVSFAVYKVPEIADALDNALNRGVSLQIVAETPDESEGKIAYGLVATFGPDILDRAQVLVWPIAQRPKNSSGKHGSLHAKCAVADGEWVFLSSANLTHYALTLNLEVGTLIHNRGLADEILYQFQTLVESEILYPIQPSIDGVAE